MAAVSVGIQLLLSVLLPVLVFRLSLRWLRPDQEARAWPDVSLYCAVLMFGPLCLPFHFARVRPGPASWSPWLSVPLGVLLGLLSTVGCLVCGAVAGMALEWYTSVDPTAVV